MKTKIFKFIVAAGIGTMGHTAAGQGVSTEKQGKSDFVENSSVGVRLNMVSVESLGDPVFGYGALWNYRLNEKIDTEVNLDYWSRSSGTLADQSIDVSDYSVGVGARYRFLDVIEIESTTPFVGIGLAVHRFEVNLSEKTDDGEVIDQFEDKYSDVEAELGTDVAGGMIYLIDQNIHVIGQARYRNMFDNQVEMDHWSFDGALALNL